MTAITGAESCLPSFSVHPFSELSLVVANVLGRGGEWRSFFISNKNVSLPDRLLLLGDWSILWQGATALHVCCFPSHLSLPPSLTHTLTCTRASTRTHAHTHTDLARRAVAPILSLSVRLLRGIRSRLIQTSSSWYLPNVWMIRGVKVGHARHLSDW